MRISMKEATTVLNMLLEGMSIRACERITGTHRDTIYDLILLVGDNCGNFLDTQIHGLEVKDIQVDEIWSFVGCKNKTAASKDYNEDSGDSWTTVAIERNTKLAIAHHVGERDSTTICTLLQKLSDGSSSVPTDWQPTRSMCRSCFATESTSASSSSNSPARKKVDATAPAKIIGIKKKTRFGNPDESMISTSHVERFNLTIRMNNRRFTRLTNAHSKNLKHHVAIQNIFFAWYNFCRNHSTIGMTPAMASGLAEKAWTIKQLLENAAQI